MNCWKKRILSQFIREIFKISSLDELLEKENTLTVHQRNIQTLAIEMYKVKHKIAPNLMFELFKETENSYNLQDVHTFRIYNVQKQPSRDALTWVFSCNFAAYFQNTFY